MVAGLRLESAGGVEVIKAEKAGIYDVKVIRGENAAAILGWLKENGFSFHDSDIQVLEDYVNRKWCFVVAKVQPDPETEEYRIVSQGMVAPVILKFETDKAVYPLALTSTVGASTEVLLYTLSQKKLSCGERLVVMRPKHQAGGSHCSPARDSGPEDKSHFRKRAGVYDSLQVQEEAQPRRNEKGP